MKKLSLVLIILLAFSGIAFAEVQIGANYHITGCENGELLVTTVYMWDKAAYRRIVGKLSSTSNSDQCQGEIVKVLDAKVVNGRLRYKVKSVVNGDVGWITHFFIGRKVE